MGIPAARRGVDPGKPLRAREAREGEQTRQWGTLDSYGSCLWLSKKEEVLLTHLLKITESFGLPSRVFVLSF